MEYCLFFLTPISFAQSPSQVDNEWCLLKPVCDYFIFVLNSITNVVIQHVFILANSKLTVTCGEKFQFPEGECEDITGNLVSNNFPLCQELA